MMLDALPLDFLLNLFLVALLLATIGYCAILNKRLSNMRDAHAELRHLTEEFDKALVRSKVGVDELKSLAQTTGKQFRDEISQAKELIEELQLINASSTRIADRLQMNVAASAKRENTGTFVDDPAGLFDDEEDEVVLGAAQEEPKKFRTDAEKELLDMLTKST
ncbi:DUF6468 domain-containing protein [uncultured Sneathiella sp.]|jgi:arsenate reductase-like glutaredoxin family protein|uniref:DUF6468 domain-containing protein n=1 Tax=uncultured Sneathiella sp. TaxID=879315 RepID=UPI0030D6E477|tara:strand:+ start:523 stop:1014 length:492 start_codon:yes stop_codon:yes gene_type:complete